MHTYIHTYRQRERHIEKERKGNLFTFDQFTFSLSIACLLCWLVDWWIELVLDDADSEELLLDNEAYQISLFSISPLSSLFSLSSLHRYLKLLLAKKRLNTVNLLNTNVIITTRSISIACVPLILLLHCCRHGCCLSTYSLTPSSPFFALLIPLHRGDDNSENPSIQPTATTTTITPIESQSKLGRIDHLVQSKSKCVQFFEADL